MSGGVFLILFKLLSTNSGEKIYLCTVILTSFLSLIAVFLKQALIRNDVSILNLKWFLLWR
jgi:hypothetical protein